MKKKEIDVLNLEWMSYSARDRNMSSLVSNYLRYQGFSVVEESVFRGFEMIDMYKPKLVFIANGIGAKINFHLVKYASLKGIKVVTLISEGNFKDDLNSVTEFLWGWNREHYLYEDSHLQWSERTRNLSLVKYPICKGKIKISGACGFDIYKIKKPSSKFDFLKKFGKEAYSKVVGVGCWDFGPCYPDNPRTDRNLSVEVKARFQKDRGLFNRVLINIIKSNPSILFIIKEHPGNTLGHYMSGIDEAEGLDNALILKYEPIVDTIAACDIWLTYESTTVIEAWLLGKPTCLLNPTGLDFPRANVFQGSPNYPNEESLQSALDNFYETGKLPHFEDEKMVAARNNVIRETIQWEDGLNHVRAGNEIIRVLQSEVVKKRSKVPMDILLHRIKQKVITSLRIKKSSIYQNSQSFSVEEVNNFSSELYEEQLKYYKSLNLSKEELLKILPI